MPRTKTNRELAVACPRCRVAANSPCISRNPNLPPPAEGTTLRDWIHPARSRAYANHAAQQDIVARDCPPE